MYLVQPHLKKKKKPYELDRVRCFGLIMPNYMHCMFVCVRMKSNLFPNSFTISFTGWSVRYKCTESVYWTTLQHPNPSGPPCFLCFVHHLLNGLLLQWVLWGASELHVNSHPSRQNSCVCCVNKDQRNSLGEGQANLLADLLSLCEWWGTDWLSTGWDSTGIEWVISTGMEYSVCRSQLDDW